MIYQPLQIFNVKENIAYGVIRALVQLAGDFIAGNLKPWAFYPGVALGNMAAATGIPGAAATIYVVGDTVDALLFHSPDGSEVRVFLNGVVVTSIDTYAAAATWELLNINGLLGGITNRIDFENLGNTNPEASGANWLALGPITVNGATASAQSASGDFMDTVAFRIQDAEDNSPMTTLPVYIPSGLSVPTLQAIADAFAPEIDDVTGGFIAEINVTLSLTLPGGLKTLADAGHFNERGGLITFNTTGPNADSVRIPAILTSIMSGDSFSLEQANIAALIGRLTSAQTYNAVSVRPRTSQDYQFTDARSGRRSFRKR